MKTPAFRRVALCFTACLLFVLTVILVVGTENDALADDNQEKPVVGLEAGFDHTVILREDGTVWNWGRQSEAQLGTSQSSFRNQSTPARARTMWSSDKTGFAPDPTFPYPAEVFNNITAIASHKMHNLALRSDGTLWAWGWGWEGQKGSGRLIDGSAYPSAQAAPVMNRRGIGTSAHQYFLRGIVAIDVGMLFSAALRNDGTVLGWGQMDSRNQTGAPPINSDFPVLINGLENIIAISAGNEHLLALDEDGIIWGLGQNNWGQIGDGATTYALTPVRVEFPTGVTILQIEGGGTHSAALTNDGYVYTWGRNNNGQLGFASETELVTIPTRVEGIDRIVRLAANRDHTLALHEDGTIWAWGWNRDGQLGIGTRINSNVPVQVTGITNARYITAGDGHSAAILADGRVMTWGRNWDGQLGIGNPSSSAIPLQVDNLYNMQGAVAGASFLLALHDDGTVSGWGRNNHHQLIASSTTDQRTPVRAQNTRPGWDGVLDNVIELAPGTAINYTHVLAIRDVGSPEGGAVYSWGWNMDGQGGIGRRNRDGMIVTDIRLDIPRRVRPVEPGWAPQGLNPRLTYEPYDVNDAFDDIIATAAGERHSVALRADGTVWTWGRNDHGQLGGLPTGSNQNGENRRRLRPRQVPGLYNITAIESGHNHIVALDANGTVWAWGRNNRDQLGPSDRAHVFDPAQVQGLDNIIAISAHGDFTLALDANSNVWAWGLDGGRLGYNLTHPNPPSSRVEPLLVLMANGEPLSGITKIQAGFDHSVAVRNDGTLWSWGSTNAHGQLGNGTTGTAVRRAAQVLYLGELYVNSVQSIALGSMHTVIVDDNGNVWSWGNNMTGALGVGSIPGDSSYQTTPVFVRSGNTDFSVLVWSDYIPMTPNLAPTPTPSPTTIIPGNVTGSGTVSAADVGMLRAYLAGFPVTIIREAADVNGDGEITAADLGLIRAYLAGFPVTLMPAPSENYDEETINMRD